MNLETTLTDSKTKYPNKMFNYKLSPKHAKHVLRGLSKNVFCSLANNHILDYKVEGLKETVTVLNDLGIHHTGADLNLKKAQKLVTIKVNKTVVGFLSAANHYSYWAAGKNREGIWYIDHTKFRTVSKVLKIVKKAKMKCDILIFSCHMHPNYVDKISDSIKRFYRALVNHGVDIVHGHSPHHVLPIKRYKNGYMMYSLGDFVDDYAVSQEYRNDLGCLVDVWIKDKKIVKYKIYPTRIYDLQVKFLKPQSKDYKHILTKMKNKEDNFIIYVTGFGPFGKFKKNPSQKVCHMFLIEGVAQECKVFNVPSFSSAIADSYFSDIEKFVDPKKKVLFLHFGLNPNRGCIIVEKRAKNEFEGKKINKGLPIDHHVSTKLESFGKKTITSTAAGDWLCNYIYYRSIEFTNKNPNWFSLFIHLPPQGVISIKDQYKIVKNIIKSIKI
jgi:poly-gamma-glutamate capsule biosynthesis protein CapA/YwtB (metallophosphatase superfamily)/pyrrolidone-carboxylate peptidase